jgi:hypothetical protein
MFIGRKHRLKYLKRLAQAQAAPSTGTPPTTSPPINKPATTINIRALPKFNSNLFAQMPDIIGSFDAIVNIINKYIITLSNSEINFNIVYTNPSISGDEYSGSLKNLLNIAKWLYNDVFTVNRKLYSMQDLTNILNDLISTTKSYSFPEATASAVSSDIVNLAMVALTKLK